MAQVRGLKEFVLDDFLAGLFLYTVQVSNAKLQPHVKEITDEYMDGFANQRASVSFVSKYGESSFDVAKSIGADSVALALVAEAGGNCLRCGKKIAVSHSSDDDSVSYGTRYTLSPGDDIVVCANCRCELTNASDEEKLALHQKKSDLHIRSLAREAMSRRLFCFPREKSTQRRCGWSSRWKIWICPASRRARLMSRSRRMCWSIPV